MSQIRSANNERRAYNPYGRYAKKPGVVTILKDKMATWWNWMFHRTNHEYIIQRSESYQQSIIVPINYQIEKAQIVEKDHVPIRQNRNKRIIPIEEFLAEEESGVPVEVPKKKHKVKNQKNHIDLIKKRRLNDPVQKMEVQVVKVDIGNLEEQPKNTVLLDQITPNKQPEPTNELATNLMQQIKQERKPYAQMDRQQIKEVLQRGLMKRVSSNLQDLQADAENSHKNSPKKQSEIQQPEQIVQTQDKQEIQTPPIELKLTTPSKQLVEVQQTIVQIIQPKSEIKQPVEQSTIASEKKTIQLDASSSLFSSNFVSKYPQLAQKEKQVDKVPQKFESQIKSQEPKQAEQLFFSFSQKKEIKEQKPAFSLQSNKEEKPTFLTQIQNKEEKPLFSLQNANKEEKSYFQLPTMTNISFADALKDQQQVLKIADQKPQLEYLKSTIDSIKQGEPIKQVSPLRNEDLIQKDAPTKTVITIQSPLQQSPVRQPDPIQGQPEKSAGKPLFDFSALLKQKQKEEAASQENKLQSENNPFLKVNQEVKPLIAIAQNETSQKKNEEENKSDVKPPLFSLLTETKKPEIFLSQQTETQTKLLQYNPEDQKPSLFSFLSDPKKSETQQQVEIQKITVVENTQQLETKPISIFNVPSDQNPFKDIFKTPAPQNPVVQTLITPQFQLPANKPSLDTTNDTVPDQQQQNKVNDENEKNLIPSIFKQDKKVTEQTQAAKANLETPVAIKSIFTGFFQDQNQKPINPPQQGTNGSEKDSNYTFGQQANNTLASDAQPKLDKSEEQQNNPFLSSPSKNNEQVKVYWNNLGVAGDLNIDKSSTPSNTNLSKDLFKPSASNLFRDTSQFQLSSGQSSNQQFSNSQPQLTNPMTFFPVSQQNSQLMMQPAQSTMFGSQPMISPFQPIQQQQQFAPQIQRNQSMQDCMEEDGMQCNNNNQFNSFQNYQPQQPQQQYQYQTYNDYQNPMMPPLLNSQYSQQFFAPNPQSVQQAQNIFNINPQQQQQQFPGINIIKLGQSLFSEQPAQQTNRQSSQNNSSFTSNSKKNKKQRIYGNE